MGARAPRHTLCDGVDVSVLILLLLQILVNLVAFHSLLQDISELATSIYIPRGVNVASLSQEALWPFHPSKIFKV